MEKSLSSLVSFLVFLRCSHTFARTQLRQRSLSIKLSKIYTFFPYLFRVRLSFHIQRKFKSWRNLHCFFFILMHTFSYRASSILPYYLAWGREHQWMKIMGGASVRLSVEMVKWKRSRFSDSVRVCALARVCYITTTCTWTIPRLRIQFQLIVGHRLRCSQYKVSLHFSFGFSFGIFVCCESMQISGSGFFFFFSCISFHLWMHESSENWMNKWFAIHGGTFGAGSTSEPYFCGINYKVFVFWVKWWSVCV